MEGDTRVAPAAAADGGGIKSWDQHIITSPKLLLSGVLGQVMSVFPLRPHLSICQGTNFLPPINSVDKTFDLENIDFFFHPNHLELKKISPECKMFGNTHYLLSDQLSLFFFFFCFRV